MTVQLIRSDPGTASGSITVSAGSEEERHSLREQFERSHCVRIRSFLSAPLLDQVQHEVEQGEFYDLETGWSTEQCMRATRVSALLDFVTNDPVLFEFVRTITGCGPIGAFIGRVYRMLPGPAYEGDWHDDGAGRRMVAMSINLSTAPYRGGVLEIREAASGEILHHEGNLAPGDAVMFRIHDDLEHRVSTVEDNPRTAYAGWFISAEELDYLRLINFPGREDS